MGSSSIKVVLIDELSDEDDIAEDEDLVATKETELSKFLKLKHPGKKAVKGSAQL